MVLTKDVYQIKGEKERTRRRWIYDAEGWTAQTTRDRQHVT